MVARIKAITVAHEAAWANKAPIKANNASMGTEEATTRLRAFLRAPARVHDVAQVTLKSTNIEAQNTVREVIEAAMAPLTAEDHNE